MTGEQIKHLSLKTDTRTILAECESRRCFKLRRNLPDIGMLILMFDVSNISYHLIKRRKMK